MSLCGHACLSRLDSYAYVSVWVIMIMVLPFALLSRYGGGPPVVRRVINTRSVQDDRLAVEVYPLRIRLTVTPNETELIVRLSKQVVHFNPLNSLAILFCIVSLITTIIISLIRVSIRF